MPLIRYEVTLPADARAHPTAFAPVPASNTSFWSKNMAQGWTVTGQPGTQRIPAPYSDVGPSARPGSPLPGGSGGGMAGGSRYAPPFWYPSLYWARQALAGSIGGVRAGWLVNARQGEAGRPMHALTMRYGSGQAAPTTAQPGMRALLAGRRMPGTHQVATRPNTPHWPRWRGRRG
jgi:hypothetical protein